MRWEAEVGDRLTVDETEDSVATLLQSDPAPAAFGAAGPPESWSASFGGKCATAFYDL